MKDYLGFTFITVGIFVAFYYLALKHAEDDIQEIAILAEKAATVQQAVSGAITGANDLLKIIKSL